MEHLDEILARRPRWYADAACADPAIPVDVFYPVDGDYRAASAVCSSCPVRTSCRDAGLSEYGWWGGDVGGRERVPLRRDRRAPLCSSASCGRRLSTTGFRHSGGRWCSLDCFRADTEASPADLW